MSSLKALVDFANVKLDNKQEARFLVEHVAGMSLAQGLIAEFEPGQLEEMENELVGLIARRISGEPLQYVLGTWDFRTLRLMVDKRVLIPRPETEDVCGAALRIIGDKPSRVIDLGTGSGAIALSIVKEASKAKVHATDYSPDALDVARANAENLEIDQTRLQFHHGSWFEPLPKEIAGQVDLIVSNPPYLRELDRDELATEVVDWEPEAALFGGQEGLDDLKMIIGQARHWLRPGGALILECAQDQAAPLAHLATEEGFASATVGQDMTGRDRWIEATAPQTAT